jgi:hypothetical protein
VLPAESMSRALSLAGFQVTLIGRIWVTPEAVFQHFSIKPLQKRSQDRKSCCGPNQKSLIKTKGSVLPVLPCGPGPESKWCLDDVAWISAAGDYVELHTRNATHLLRETMNLWARSLTQLALPVFISACNLRILSDTGQRKTPIAFACESGERVGDSRRNHRNRRFRNRTSGISLLANPSSPAGTRSFPHDCPDSVPSYLDARSS